MKNRADRPLIIRIGTKRWLLSICYGNPRLHPCRRWYARWLGEELLDLTGEEGFTILGVMNALNEAREEVVKRYYLRDVHF